MKTSIQRLITVTPYPEEMAEIWWNMNSDDQVMFLNKLGEYMSHSSNGEIQMQYITDTKWLTDKGRYVMQLMGEYADKEPRKSL